MRLACNAMVKFLSGIILVGSMLFLPAGTLQYCNGWLFMGLLFVPMLILGLALLVKAPELLKKRLDAKEENSAQKAVVGLAALSFVAGFVIAGLDYRFQWSNVPGWLVGVASVILLVSYGLYGEVMRENAYLSRTIQIQENQKLVDTGLYGLVRHPMYAVTIWLFLSIPLVLGSWWSFFCFLLYVPVIVLRILNEESLLRKDLEGYADYCRRVRYRLFPGIW